jgi:transposase-like protein
MLQHPTWRECPLPLNLREVEDLGGERGIEFGRETICQWLVEEPRNLSPDNSAGTRH